MQTVPATQVSVSLKQLQPREQVVKQPQIKPEPVEKESEPEETAPQTTQDDTDVGNLII
jgi:hypothetical protein